MTVDTREARYRLTLEKDGDTGALKELGEDVESLAEVSGAAAPKVTALGDQAATAGQRGAAAWADFVATVKEVTGLDLSELTPDDLVGDGFRRARQDLGALLEKAEQGTESIPKFATRARLSIDQLRETTARLKRAGIGLTDRHERELEALERQYRTSLAAAEKFRKKQIEVRKEMNKGAAKTGDYTRSFTSLGDAVSSLGPRMRNLTAIGGTVVAGLTAGYAAGQRLMGFLGEMDRQLGTKMVPTINNFVKETLRVQWAMDKVAGATPTVSENADELRNVLHQLKALGVEPVGEELSKLRQQLEDVRKAKADDAAATQQATARYQEWAKSLGLSREALENAAGELGGNLQRFLEEATGDIDFEAVAAKLEGPLAEVLTGLEVQGLEVPEGLQDAVDELFDKVEDSLRERAENLDGAALEEAVKKPLERMLEAFKGAPPEIRERLLEIAAQFDVLDERAQKSGDRVAELAQRYVNEMQRAAGALELVEDTETQLAALQKAFDDINPEDIDRQLADLTEAEADELRETVQKHIEGLRDLGGEYTEKIRELATRLGILIPPWGKIEESASAAGESMERSAESARRAGEAAEKAQAQLSGLGDSAAEGGQGVEQGASQAEEAAKRYRAAGDDAKAGAEGFEEQRSATEGAAEANKAAAASAEQLAASQERIKEGTDGVGEAVASIHNDLVGLGAAYQAATEQVTAMVDSSKSKLGELKAEVSSLRLEVKGLVDDLARVHAGPGGGGSAPADGEASVA